MGSQRQLIQMRYRVPVILLLLVFYLSLIDPLETHGQTQPTNQMPTHTARCDIAFPLPNASDTGTKKFEKLLYGFLDQGCYKNWVADSEIRNTGPFIGGLSYGTHDAVKVFYSSQVWEWLKIKNREGEIPDGAMIVTKMFPSPARQGAKLTGWTVMVKDKKAVFDGWYWSYHAPNYAPANPAIDYPDSGFGLYCLRCHASAEKESTFITVKNVEGSPISFNVEMPTMLPLPPEKEDMHSRIARTPAIAKSAFAKPRTSPNPYLISLLKVMPDVTAEQVKPFPG